MALSGVSIEDECVTLCDDVRMKRVHKYVLYTVDGPKIKIYEKGSKTATHEDFCSALKDDQPVYAILDYDFINQHGQTDTKLFFINWCPDTAPLKKKMVQSASKDALKNKLKGIHAEIQANDRNDILREVFNDKVKK